MTGRQMVIDGQPFLVGIGIDITEHKRVEEKLQTMQKFQSIGTLAGGIAHNFNNILQGLYGNISFAKEELPKGHPVCALLEEAEKSMTRAVRLTKQLLTFAKGGTPIKENVSLVPLVEEVARIDLTGSSVSLVYHPDANLWTVDADKSQIQQVVSALVINARQAMPNGGHLYIALENADLLDTTLPSLSQGKYVRVTVRDDGPGIAPELLGQIFDPFFSTKQTGRGLGLATVWSIVTKHGGQISVESEVGKGTTFTLYLPASEAPQKSEATPSDSEHPTLRLSRPAKILVMDDEVSICRLAVHMLSSCGYSLANAPGGREAIELYKQALEADEPFDLVIMDLTIPGGVGGIQAIKELLTLNPNARAIVSSGYAEDPAMANPTAYGFKDAVAKPYSKNDLREVVARVLA
jgi:nitrogen-specific signal transduction histidine kinase/ActR/RegA family two-component response regulator